MDNVPPLNLSTSIKIQDSHPSEAWYVQYGINSIQDPLTITGEPVSDNHKINAVDEYCKDASGCKEEPESEYLFLDEQAEGTFVVKTNIEKTCSKNKLYQCTTCNESFSRANQLRHHEKLHMSKKNLCCDTCSEKFETANELIAHRAAAHSVKEVILDGDYTADNTATTENATESKKPAARNNYEKKFTCPVCGVSFLREVYLITHLRKHTGEKPFECDVCQSRFKQMSHLTTHMRTHTQDRPYTCHLCQSSFSQTGSLRRHLRSHTGEKPFKCDECDALFVEKRNLSRHKLSHSGERPFKCDMCPSSFTQLIDLKRHKLSHFGIKPFKCDLCGGSFSRKNNLRWHRLTHEGKTLYNCEICNVGFRLAKDLKNHEHVHSPSQNVKAFPLEKCDIKPSDINNFGKHNAINGRDTLLCNLCGEILYTDVALMKHIKKHDRDKKFPCNLCPMSFTHMKPLKKHKVIVHNEPQPTKINKIKSVADAVPENEKDMEIAVIAGDSDFATEPSVADCPPPKDNMNTITSDAISSVFIDPVDKSVSDDQSTILFTQPGVPPKTGRPAGNCPNHEQHLQTVVEGEYGQYQVWCFCETPSIPSTSSNITAYTYPTTAAATVTLASTHVTSTASDTLMQPQMVDEIHYAAPEFDQSMHHYLSERTVATAGGMPFKSGTDVDGISVAQQKCNLSTGFYPTGMPRKSDEGSSLQAKPISDDVFIDRALKNNSPINLSSCNNSTIELMPVEISHRSDDVLQSRKGSFLNKDATSNSYLLGTESNHIARQCSHNNMRIDINNIVDPESDLIAENQNIPFSTNSIVNVNQDVKIESLSFGNQSKLPLPKNYLSHTLDDKIFISSDFSSAFLSDGLSKKSVASKPDTMSIQVSSGSFSKEPKKSFAAPDFPAFESVFQEFSSDVCSDKGVPLQYSLTVNNPATGDIQVQSDLFPKLNHTTSPTKKRKLDKSDIEPNKIKTKVCPFCYKSFSKQNSYDYHVRTHTGEKSMMCGICHQTFTHKNTLIAHIRNHTGERPYVCKECNASFTQKSNLAVHYRTHTGERPFSCNLCESSFSQGSHLKAHRRIHFNHRPYVCKTCNHAFTQKSALTRHEGKHSNKRNLKCKKSAIVLTSKEPALSSTEEPPVLDKANPPLSHAETPTVADDCKPKSKRKKIALLRNDETLPVSSETVADIVHGDPLAIHTIAEESTSLINVCRVSDVEVPKLKHQPAILQPTRRSRRILESATKTCSNKNSDFITGNLDEIDRAEEIENMLAAVKPRQDRKKPPNNAEVEQWCFCEVAHGPNEPHTNIQEQAISADAVSEQPKCTSQPNHIENIAANPDTVYQLSIPNLSHTIVLQGDDNGLPIRNEDIILQANGAQHAQLPITISSSGSDFNNTQFSTVTVTDDQRLLGDRVKRAENHGLFEPSSLINQVYMARQIVTPEGNTLYTLDPEGMSGETVVLNSPAGTIFFEVSPDGQMLALPMQEPIVVGSVSDVQNTISISSSSGDLSSVMPAPLTLPIGSLEPHRETACIMAAPDDEKVMATFNNSSVVASVDIVPLANNFIDMLDDGNIDFDAGCLSSRTTNRKPSPQAIVVMPAQCALCGREFAQKSGLQRHMTDSHTEYLYCQQCYKVFRSRTELQAHQAEHSVESVCRLCHAVFDGKDQLQRHRAEFHYVPRVKRDDVNCKPCGVSFTQVTDFKRHMQSHLGIKPFVCKECGAAFTRKSSMNKHERIHTGEKPYTCPDCNKSFFYRYQFNRHRSLPCSY